MICLMPNCAYLSETSRVIAIYKALQRLGADAVVATHGGIHEALLQSENVPYDVVGPRMSAERCRRFVQDGVGVGRPDQSIYSPDEMRTYVHAEAAYFREHEVKAILTGFTLTALLSSRLVGAPVITEHAGTYIPPVFERGLLPAASQNLFPIFNYMPRGLARWLQNKGAPRLKLYLSGFNNLARELGVEPIPSFPALLLGDLVLVTEAPEVLGITREEMSAWRPTGGAYRPSTRLAYTGPIFAELDIPIPDNVEHALQGSSRPLVYVALTSTPAAVIRSVVAELRKMPVHLIVAGTVHDLGDVSGPNVTAGGVLPSHHIMPRVAAAVVTGGQGSVQCAMAAGTPIVGIPLQPEQDANLAFLERHGAAMALPPKELGTGKLRKLVETALSDVRFRAAAQQIKSTYARLNGPVLSAQAILDYLADPVRP